VTNKIVSNNPAPEPLVIKKNLIKLVSLVSITVLFCICLQTAVDYKIKRDIECHVGDKYAILALHSGGKNFESPSVWQLMKLFFLYKTNITKDYRPSGSGGFTGKNHYIAILITDNIQIHFAEWSFRNLGLVFGDLMPHDKIENLSDADQDLYCFKSSDLEQRRGLIYKASTLNDDGIRFYWRQTNKGAQTEPTLDFETINLESSLDIPLVPLD